MKKIMILGASVLQLPAIKKAKELGLQVIAVDMDENAIGFQEKNIIREVISTIETKKILESAKKHHIDGIMTLASDMPMRSVAVVAKELGLVGITEETALNATNKAEMRKCLKKSGVPIPQFFHIRTKEEYDEAIDFFKSLKLKCIVKPVDNSGSRGVDLLSDLSNKDLVSRGYGYSKNYSRNGDLILEEYMEGAEVSVESISVDGECHVIQITDKLTTGAPYFVEMGHSQPSVLSRKLQQEISVITKTAVKAIGIENGPSHTEIKITKDGPKIVELGARLGGDNITTHLVPLSTGVDMVENCIKIALGEKPILVKKFNKGSAIRYFKVQEGNITAILGKEDVEKIQGVVQVNIIHGVGERISEIRNSTERAGFVIAQGDNAEEAISICNEALGKIMFEVI